jgi:hypothetical protein
MTMEDAIAAQYGLTIPAFAKPTFERFRRARHSAQYFDPAAPEIDESDADWAIATARKAVTAVERVLADDPPGPYPRP